MNDLKPQNLYNVIKNRKKKELFNLVNNTQYSSIKIKKIINQTENRKILFNKNINKNIILKVKELNWRNITSLYYELLAYKKLNTCRIPNISKKIKSILCNTDKEQYRFLQKEKLNLCTQGKSNIPIIIFVLEYKKGISFYEFIQIKSNLNKTLFNSFIQQLFLILYKLIENGIIYNDLNLNNFLVDEENGKYTISLIDLDKILFGADIDNEKAIIGSLLNSNSIFYRIIMSLKSTFEEIINYTEVSDKLFWINDEDMTLKYIINLDF